MADKYALETEPIKLPFPGRYSTLSAVFDADRALDGSQWTAIAPYARKADEIAKRSLELSGKLAALTELPATGEEVPQTSQADIDAIQAELDVIKGESDANDRATVLAAVRYLVVYFIEEREGKESLMLAPDDPELEKWSMVVLRWLRSRVRPTKEQPHLKPGALALVEDWAYGPQSVSR